MKNGNLRNITKKLLSDNWYKLYKYIFEYQREDGEWEKQEREVYDCGDAAATLLYNVEKQTVILTRQFRMPTYQNENQQGDGMQIEVCAGLLEGDAPDYCSKKEALEETGYKLDTVTKIFDSYMVPGTVMQKVHFFIASYTEAQKVTKGGGADDETENIEVLEYSFDKAFAMIASGEIKDAKTVMLLQHAKIVNLFES
ncbi:NUDIX domain-containing protein [Cellulophaga baltica]|uniref:NUDIX domain-containing protein n=1 Tax=Cellulophaga TaxID=104264 RepID=UPI001C0724C0|nr:MULTISPECIES: NUDIX domain-containing protein [Cellulophaga]MBU2997897.1 NUDIX domain-containing protein [Cellulophaga baltica]MDO6769298.1 NUDIX domain-containing protein [Cellulophaga sp. 1_MG-2023]